MAATASSLTQFKLKPQNDAYTVLLSISLVSMIAACVLLFYDLKKYPSLAPDQSKAFGNIGAQPFPPGGEKDPRGGPANEPPNLK
jgi:hypothetical protein